LVGWVVLGGCGGVGGGGGGEGITAHQYERLYVPM